MINIPIKMQLLSYLLCASGEGRANVNAEVVFDDYGFPYFPGRRLKGLLKESMVELLEIQGKPTSAILSTIQRFFGCRGRARNEGLLYVDDLHTEGHAACRRYLESHSQPRTFSPANIRDYYTCLVQQTAIDDQRCRRIWGVAANRLPGLLQIVFLISIAFQSWEMRR